MLKLRAAIENRVSSDLEKVETINKLLVDRESLMGFKGGKKLPQDR